MTLAAVRSRITVSSMPGSRVAGSVSGPTRATCPGPCTGATGVCPLFQLASEVHWPSELVTHNAGTSWSFRNSIPPWATLTSMSLLPLL
ncbi:MAG TPA: hypothetical protein PJ982_16020 [Lacipirellulaceae bacterium]|nr:hypothetical protein [Lacipirellulaceae bacterium]